MHSQKVMEITSLIMENHGIVFFNSCGNPDYVCSLWMRQLIVSFSGPEYGTTQAAWRGVLEEADRLSELHSEVGDKLVNNVTVSIKQWQKENYHKSMMHFKETKDMEVQFRKVGWPPDKSL